MIKKRIGKRPRQTHPSPYPVSPMSRVRVAGLHTSFYDLVETSPCRKKLGQPNPSPSTAATGRDGATMTSRVMELSN